IVVSVSDTGIGIPAEKQERIFDAFEQADASIERQYGGTGLGLAVTRQLVELHGGELRLESTPGEGSVFSFTLKVAEEAPEGDRRPAALVAPVSAALAAPVPVAEEAPAARPVTATEAPEGAPRILVVDDDPINLQVLHNYLVAEHFDLTMASSGDEALRLLGEQTFELLLLDIMMPRMSGYEVCRTIREQLSRDELPVIFLSAKNRPTDRVTGFEEGANDYLAKPIARSELLARVEAHLELLEVHRGQLEEVKALRGLLPICCVCKKIRDDGGYWNQLEVYIHQHS
ncbi:MAG: response regulator, partial [Proteobacteria bacterium]|nr:response regulator [Pseudomonadota bacterium]